MLLCVPDGSGAGAAAKASAERLERCVTVGVPDVRVQCALVLRKFRAERLLTFERSVTAPVVAHVEAAARTMGIPSVRVARDQEARASERVDDLLGESGS